MEHRLKQSLTESLLNFVINSIDVYLTHLINKA